ncbi:MAG: type I-U CRISPR-associated helicase/endonuclease Cas3 [Gammaproteobacteria bacterium]|nr:type I-U CRISPR-associated helicase/endonuclease Cas3 [Gammaproteobacteria bacterium]
MENDKANEIHRIAEAHISELNAEDFAHFFEALWGKTPFAWQKDLAARVLSSDAFPPPDALLAGEAGCGAGNNAQPWPQAIALPTASGKTACMDVAVFALAAQAHKLKDGAVITAPRRIFFVVDRRIIVDEAYERGRCLASKLAKAEDGILKRVKDNLLYICCGGMEGFGGEQPLSVHAMRGGMYRSEAWGRNPLQPTIVASTVDQIGSRLLFRAYGRAPGTWPIYAGLVANDSLILLDEAHCSQPFLQTLQAVRKYQSWAEAPLSRSFYPVVMSATPPPILDDVFTDFSGESTNPDHPLGKRQMARKPAKLKPVPSAQGAHANNRLAKAMVDDALQLAGDGCHAVVVFVNRVATARECSRLLREQNKLDLECLLLTGRMRALDKDCIIERLKQLDLHSDHSDSRMLERPVIVVATQTLEVGADLDFDGLVTECASMDALRQRFGRLNRMGRRVDSRAAILMRGDPADPKKDDPIYGAALAATWQWLWENKDDNGEINFGIADLDARLPKGTALAELNAPSPDAPVMLPSHVDCWSQTAPEPLPSPDVDLFLHGPRDGAPDVQVCWRAGLDLSSEQAQKSALESLELCPPSSMETLPVPIGVFRRWLKGRRPSDDSADIEGASEPSLTSSQSEEAAESLPAPVVCWRGRRTKPDDIVADPTKVRPSDVIVIPTDHPGVWRELGDLPLAADTPQAALDIGDQAHRIVRAKPIIRLHSDLVNAWPDSLSGKAVARILLADDLAGRHEENPDEFAADIRSLLDALAASGAENGWAWLPKAARELQAEYRSVQRFRRGCHLINGHLILEGRRRIQELAHAADTFSDEDDATSSGISQPNGNPVRLRDHLPGVERFARQHAAGCGLPDNFAEAVARAGLLHDVGKSDPRFQSVLRGGSPWMAGEPLAKSGEMWATKGPRRQARKDSGLPQGWRHELLSVRMAESASGLLPDSLEMRDLVLHLVGSHHGHCRPFAPVVFDYAAGDAEFELNGHRMRWQGETKLERLDSGIADRYWRLTRRYGWWGLAWLESLLRLADWRRSEWEESHNAE